MEPLRESYAKVVANLASILIGVLAIGVVLIWGSPSATNPNKAKPDAVVSSPPLPVPIAKVEAPAAVPKPKAKAKPKPAPAPKPLEIDRVAVAKAEVELDALSRERARAEGRADELAKKLSETTLQATTDAQRVKNLAYKVQDPSARIARASARGGFLKAEKERLKGEIATLAATPRPKGKILSNKNPVARPADGDEQHFELRRNRVTPIDLDRLIALVKSDAQLRIRLNNGSRAVGSRVGPVGAFSLQYSLMRSPLSGLDELMERRGVSYDLRGWEVIPEFEMRGEPYEATTRPISEFARTINRLNPSKATVTLWIYPDSFALYRKLRDDLQARGFLVAARPLPEGMAIRGSPAGSLSAGQ